MPTFSPTHEIDHVAITDHAERLAERLPWVLGAKPRVRAFAESVGFVAQEMENTAIDLIVSTTLDNAEGEHLEQWGEIVGEPRGSLLDDEDYRRIISARILANKSTSTVDEVIEVLRKAAGPVFCIDYIPMFPAGFHLQAARATFVSDAMRGRIRRVMLAASPAGRDVRFIEAVVGGFAPADSCAGGGDFSGPMAREF